MEPITHRGGELSFLAGVQTKIARHCLIRIRHFGTLSLDDFVQTNRYSTFYQGKAKMVGQISDMRT